MKLMWRYTMRYKGFVLMNLICAMGFVLIELGLPTLLAQMIDVGVKNNDVAMSKKWDGICYWSFLWVFC